ncbi:MAG: ABC transporter substrate-binding protein [Rhodospirillaceae bacterium]|nr:ABC transporter substrate-binding protein [Rhodospirillaceae bacterium]
MIDRRFVAVSAPIALAMGALARPTAARAADWAQTPDGLVRRFAEVGITEVLEAPVPQKEKTVRFRKLFVEFFDIPAIGRFVLGRFARAVQPADLERFQKLFEDVIVYTWTRRFGEYKGESLNVKDSAPDGDAGALVNSDIVGKGGQAFAVSWRLRKRETGFRIVDVIVEGVSMAITYRNEYASIIQKSGGMAGLFSLMEGQVVDLAKQVDA